MIKPPVLAGTAGQASVTAMAGAVVTVQMVFTVFVTMVAEQRSRLTALNEVVTLQAFAGTVTVLVKFAVAPGARVATVKTVELAAGRSLTTTTSVRVMLPRFRTVPLYTTEPPGVIGVVGHTAVTTICGAVRIGQTEVTLLVTATPQMLRPVAVAVLVLVQFVVAR